MDERRQARIAKNEANFRDINERLEQGLRSVQDKPDVLTFICECGDRTCDQHISLSLSEYEQVRRDSRRFAVVPGHVFLETERIVSSNDRYQIVEKTGPSTEVTDETDQRVPGSAGRRDTSL